VARSWWFEPSSRWHGEPRRPRTSLATRRYPARSSDRSSPAGRRSRSNDSRLSTGRRLALRPMAISPRWLTVLAWIPRPSRLTGAAQLESSVGPANTRSSCTETRTIGGVSIRIAAAAVSRPMPHRPYSARFDPPIGIRADTPGGCRSGSSAHAAPTPPRLFRLLTFHERSFRPPLTRMTRPRRWPERCRSRRRPRGACHAGTP
jgi:hypothetical protein